MARGRSALLCRDERTGPSRVRARCEREYRAFRLRRLPARRDLSACERPRSASDAPDSGLGDAGDLLPHGRDLVRRLDRAPPLQAPADARSDGATFASCLAAGRVGGARGLRWLGRIDPLRHGERVPAVRRAAQSVDRAAIRYWRPGDRRMRGDGGERRDARGQRTGALAGAARGSGARARRALWPLGDLRLRPRQLQSEPLEAAMNPLRIAGAALAVSLLAAPAIAAPPSDLDAFVAQSLKTFGPPGMIVAVVEDGKPVVTKGYGICKLGNPAPVDAHTIFPIGSETKAFTAAALAILVDEGKLKWDDRVASRLPGFQMYDPYATEHMTVRDLLTHRSGLGLGEGDLLIIPATTRSRADIVHALRFLKPATGFREGYAYDNILYIVAGALVEAVSGETWEHFVENHIFKPVGMTDSATAYDIHAKNGIALHARTSGPIRGLGPQGVLLHGLEGGA